MRQYAKQHKEVLIVAITLFIAMSIQYLRIVSLDIAFLFEVNTPTFMIYFAALIAISMLVLLFVFLPMLVITEIAICITLPSTITIDIKRVVYNIKSTTSNHTNRQRRTTILRC
ncbi:MAG: hypothetical protein ACVCEJ_05930 [Candidatus Izemoplasmataceae bacterium]